MCDCDFERLSRMVIFVMDIAILKEFKTRHRQKQMDMFIMEQLL